jgi:hypothetical protein
MLAGYEISAAARMRIGLETFVAPDNAAGRFWPILLKNSDSNI